MDLKDWVYRQGYRDFSDLTGKNIVNVSGLDTESEEVIFTCDDGKRYRMHHDQDCCESVAIAQIDGDAEDIIGKVLEARQEDGETPSDYNFGYEPESYTWTFYIIRTERGTVTIRWLGQSNGYYSESVSFKEIVQ